mmetsp:Transcript_11543/g.29486  ORF Transcript_11543/g.29486 Transcript_11543/m.29486 type:complete len:279 (-) Transcript_11543:5-841(-)|eukprot:jgi/Tetstr1/424784/TSEL_001481.t1
MGNTCCGGDRRGGEGGVNRLSRQLEQRKANYAATGIVPLRDARLEALPPFVAELGERVKTLDVTNNRLTELPGSIEANAALVRLVVARNLLASLPLELYGLAGLKVLNLEGNRLASLPPGISGLQRLDTLNVSSNVLRSLPEELGQLGALKILHCAANRLEALPAALGSCASLEELHAGDNFLSDIPPELGALSRLKLAVLDGNRIEGVPPAVLQRCVALQTLSLHGNPITPAALEATEGFADFEERRRTKFDKQLAHGVLLGKAGLDEGVDRATTRQ